MSKEQSREAGAGERVLHFLVIGGILLLLCGAGGMIYLGVTGKMIEKPNIPDMKQDKGMAKPLPDFIVDKIKLNELEQLKP